MSMSIMAARAMMRHAPIVRDPYSSYVVSLLHMSGANGSTVITDEVSGNSWIASDDTPPPASLSNAEYVFAPTSLSVRHINGQFAMVNDQARFALGSNDFTFEGFVYTLDLSANYEGIWSKRASSTTENSYALATSPTTAEPFFQWSTTGTDSPSAGWSSPILGNQWWYVSINRHGPNLLFFIGSLGGTAQLQTISSGRDIGTDVIYPNTRPMTIGQLSILSNNGSWNGYIQETRFTNGICRYTSNYPVPTAPFVYP